MIKKLLCFLLILAFLMWSVAFAASFTADYSVDGGRVTITVKGESYRPVSLVVQDGSRKYYIDQKETDASGKAVFETQLEQGKEYKCTVNLDGAILTQTIKIAKDDPGVPEQPEKPGVAYIYIKGYRGVILPKTEVEIRKGDTVMSLTKRVLNSKGIDFKTRFISGLEYMESIDGQSEFDKGPLSGWMFTVNGEDPSAGATEVPVRDGDYIQWLYTTNLGKDIGIIYDQPRSEIIDEAIALLDGKNASEKEIINMVKAITEYLVDSVGDVKSKDDIKAVLRDLKDVNDIFLKVLARLKSEEGFDSAASSCAKIAEAAIKLLSYADEASKSEISLLVQKYTGITLAFADKMGDEGKIDKIIDDLLDLSLELSTKLIDTQPDNLKPEQSFLVYMPQQDEDSVAISLPGVFFDKAAERGITKLELSSEILTLIVPMDALNEIHKEKGLKITAKKADKEALAKSVQEQIPDGSLLIEITEASGKNFMRPIEIGIPFAGKYSDEAAVTVFLLKEDGSILAIGGIYDSAIKKAIFFSEHFSTYFAKESIADFKDTKNHWASKEIGILAGKGIIKGKAEGIFDPDSSITRAEFVALMTRALGHDESPGYLVPFTDVTQNDWYYSSIAIAYNKGLVSGKSTTEFDPNGKITRQEMAKIVANIVENKFQPRGNLDDLRKFKDFEEIAPWAREAVALCLREKIMSGVSEGKFAPLENATRAQAAMVLYRIYGLLLK